jgi:cullin 1
LCCDAAAAAAAARMQVLPPLKEMHGELLLRGLVERWGKYKRIVKFQMMVFRYLEHYYIPKKALPPLQKVSFTSFQDMVRPHASSSYSLQYCLNSMTTRF